MKNPKLTIAIRTGIHIIHNGSIRTVLCLVLLLITISLFAQNNVSQSAPELQKYQRSALTRILLQGTNLIEDKSKLDDDDARIDNSPEAIRKLWNEYPFPELYDKHDIENSNITVISNLNSQDIFNARKNKNQLKDAEKTLPKIEQELKNKRIAHQVVKRWFSSEDGQKFWDPGTIEKRGFYNASELDAQIAKQDVRGRAKLTDAADDLINNSFVTVTDLLVYANKPIADMYITMAKSFEDESKKLSAKSTSNAMEQMVNSSTALGFLTTASGLRISAAAIMDGYTVISKTYLFKLKWNEEIQAEFYRIWPNKDNASFEKMDFELEFVGFQLNETVINRGAFNKSANRNPEVVIKQAVVRNIDEAFAKLQQENDVFKPSVPVHATSPLSAKIGMKEGLRGGEKFVVLQKIQDPTTGKLTYKKMGGVTVDKTHVWDNRYNAGEDLKSESGEKIKETYFIGGKGVVPGMTLKQKK
jgi:hypothetical protein